MTRGEAGSGGGEARQVSLRLTRWQLEAIFAACAQVDAEASEDRWQGVDDEREIANLDRGLDGALAKLRAVVGEVTP